MRKLYSVGILGVAALLLGCSSDGSSKQNAGTVAPASLDFCIDWANDVCRLAYLCVDPSDQSSDFKSHFGSTTEACQQNLLSQCTSSSSSFGPSCGGGKVADPDLAGLCTELLESEPCSTWTSVPAGPCNTVCGNGTNPGGVGGAGGATGNPGSGSSGAPASSAGAPATGSLATSLDFCVALENVGCDRIFACEPDVAAAALGSVAACKTSLDATCASAEPCPGHYDASQAPACIAAAMTASCAELMSSDGEPAVCNSACE